MKQQKKKRKGLIRWEAGKGRRAAPCSERGGQEACCWPYTTPPTCRNHHPAPAQHHATSTKTRPKYPLSLETDTDGQGQTQTQTQTDADRHRGTQTDTDRHRGTRAYVELPHRKRQQRLNVVPRATGGLLHSRLVSVLNRKQQTVHVVSTN